MADFTIKNPPEYNPVLRQLEPTDPNHADVFNALFGQLINNDAFLEALAQKTAEALAGHLEDGVVHVTAQQKKGWDAKAGTAVATQATPGLMAAADKGKLDGVAEGAEANQNAYSSIKVGTVTVTANGKTATFTLEAGSNVTLSADNAAKKITVAANRDGGNADTLDGYHAEHFAAAEQVDALKKSVSDGKTSVAVAVTAKGVATAADAAFATIAENVGKISMDATAAAGDCLSGKTFYAGGVKVTGVMANHGAVTQALEAGGSCTIPAGYHNGGGKVTANSLASQTSGTVEAINHPYTGAADYSQEMLNNKTAWVNGRKVTGLIQDSSSAIGLAAIGFSTDRNELTAIWGAPDKNYARVKGSTTSFRISNVPSAIGLTADKIVQGNTILGVAGTGGGAGKQYIVTDFETDAYDHSYLRLSNFVSSLNDIKGSITLLIEQGIVGEQPKYFDVFNFLIFNKNYYNFDWYIVGFSPRLSSGNGLEYAMNQTVGNFSSFPSALSNMSYQGMIKTNNASVSDLFPIRIAHSKNTDNYYVRAYLSIY